MSDADLIRRLRSGYSNADLVTVGGCTHDGRCLSAADRINAQAAEIERLRKEVDEGFPDWWCNHHFTKKLAAERNAAKARATTAEADRDRLAAEVEALREKAAAVIWFDWSDNDSDAVAAMDALRAALASKGGA